MTGVNSLKRSAPNFVREGWRKTATPSTTPPSGGDGCQGWSSLRKRANQSSPSGIWRDGHEARPVEGRPTGGATDAGGMSPNSYQPFPSGKATKRVLSPFFTRIRTLRLPSVRALETTSRTSAGVETDLPATSRITSPVENPWSAAMPSESTPVTTTPSAPEPETRAAGAKRKTELAKISAAIAISGIGAGLLGIRQFAECQGNRLLRALVQNRQLDGSFGAIAPILLARSRASLTSLPSTEVMTSPASIPAFRAGLFACGSATSAPSGLLETEAIRDILRDRLYLNADPATRHEPHAP